MVTSAILAHVRPTDRCVRTDKLHLHVLFTVLYVCVYVVAGARTPFPGQTTFMFKSAEQDGDVRIEAFIQKAFVWYCKAVESTEDHSRYLYTLVSTGRPPMVPGLSGGGGEDPVRDRR